MGTFLVKNVQLVNEGNIKTVDILIKNGRFEQIGSSIDAPADQEIDATGLMAIPGIIDDQVHFREPGLTHKANLYTEPRAAVAGGTTTFFEMPNTKPPAVTQAKLAEKYATAAQKSIANYSFFMGVTNDNLEEVLKTDAETVCGVKIFMGSSTGNMLVDDQNTLNQIFKHSPMLIATHCEDEATIRGNQAEMVAKYGDDVPMHLHPIIRSPKGCYLSSSMAIELAKANDTRLHILHISTADELDLFDNSRPLAEKRITSEVCVHHLYFNASQYETLGAQIKCNPAIKDVSHQSALFPALLDDRLDIIATDHAPHTWDEKQNKYTSCPSGVPLVQHSLNVMLEFYQKGMISLERIIEKMCHAPAICFNIRERGFVREGYWADLVLFDPNEEWEVSKSNIHYKCGWSPFEGHTFKGNVKQTFVSGHLAYDRGTFNENKMGERALFN